MKFVRHSAPPGNTVGACDDSGVVVGGERYERSLILTSERIVPDWRPVCAEDLTEDDLLCAAEMGARGDIVLLGVGVGGVLPKPEWRALFAERGMSLETMSVRAACRTYCVLAGDGRAAVLALVFPAAA